MHEVANLLLVATAFVQPAVLQLLHPLLLLIELEFTGDQTLSLAFDFGLLGAGPGFELFTLPDERLVLQLDSLAHLQQLVLLFDQRALLQPIVFAQLQPQVGDRLGHLGGAEPTGHLGPELLGDQSHLENLPLAGGNFAAHLFERLVLAFEAGFTSGDVGATLFDLGLRRLDALEKCFTLLGRLAREGLTLLGDGIDFLLQLAALLVDLTVQVVEPLLPLPMFFSQFCGQLLVLRLCTAVVLGLFFLKSKLSGRQFGVTGLVVLAQLDFERLILLLHFSQLFGVSFAQLGFEVFELLLQTGDLFGGGFRGGVDSQLFVLRLKFARPLLVLLFQFELALLEVSFEATPFGFVLRLLLSAKLLPHLLTVADRVSFAVEILPLFSKLIFEILQFLLALRQSLLRLIERFKIRLARCDRGGTSLQIGQLPLQFGLSFFELKLPLTLPEPGDSLARFELGQLGVELSLAAVDLQQSGLQMSGQFGGLLLELLALAFRRVAGGSEGSFCVVVDLGRSN